MPCGVGSALGAYGTIKQVEGRFDAKQALEDKKNADRDKWKDLQRKSRDKRELDKAKKAGTIDEAREQIAARNERRAAADEKIAKKREAARQRNERRKRMAMRTQPLRNIVALGDAITTAGALGFDSEDFVLGFSTSGYVSGKKAKKPKVADSKNSKETSELVPTKNNGNRYANAPTGSSASVQGETRGAEQARRATTESGSSTTQNTHSRRSETQSRRYQEQYRARLAEKMYGEADVSKGNPIYSTSEDNEDFDF